MLISQIRYKAEEKGINVMIQDVVDLVVQVAGEMACP